MRRIPHRTASAIVAALAATALATAAPATAAPLEPRLAADIDPGPTGSAPDEPTAFAGRLFLGADDGTHGDELWQVGADGASLVVDASTARKAANPTT